MDRSRRCYGIAILLLVLAPGPFQAEAADRPKRADDRTTGQDEASLEKLEMTPAVACEAVRGYRDYVELPKEQGEPALTRDEKLLVYYEPRRYKIERYKQSYRVHLSQDVKVRKHGEKAVLWSKEKLVDYEVQVERPPVQIYLTNTIGLKPLPPGLYDLEIVLHDQLAQEATATQVLTFRVKPTP
ncbi:MAG: hypothetical protein IRY99_13930 [Isosphaeraceae bacterium]|nr:hypothetical protein [Isosphaeraceae bacterium]